VLCYASSSSVGDPDLAQSDAKWSKVQTWSKNEQSDVLIFDETNTNCLQTVLVSSP
jgi:hypothetical protein